MWPANYADAQADLKDGLFTHAHYSYGYTEHITRWVPLKTCCCFQSEPFAAPSHPGPFFTPSLPSMYGLPTRLSNSSSISEYDIDDSCFGDGCCCCLGALGDRKLVAWRVGGPSPLVLLRCIAVPIYISGCSARTYGYTRPLAPLLSTMAVGY